MSPLRALIAERIKVYRQLSELTFSRKILPRHNSAFQQRQPLDLNFKIIILLLYVMIFFFASFFFVEKAVKCGKINNGSGD